VKYVNGYRCILCGAPWTIDGAEYTCPGCGGNLDVEYDYAVLKNVLTRDGLRASERFDIWRYAPLLPVADLRAVPPLQIGWTPLYRAGRLGKKIGLDGLFLKDDGRNPSASFKDRASAVALARAVETGAPLVTGASTGNAGSSAACLAASLGLPVVIFVPEAAPRAKIAQLLIFGARVLAVRGSYDQAFDLCLEATRRFGWYNRNTGFNPFTREGKKTCSLEICEQLQFEAPDRVFVPVGDGNIISGIWKGFRDFYALGLIDRLPRIVAVQSTRSAAVVKAVDRMVRRRGAPKPVPEGEAPPAILGQEIEVEPVRATTVADSISVDLPRDGAAAVRAVLESGGDAVAVEDEAILEAIRLLAREEGIFGEPAGVASLAGLLRLVEKGEVGRAETLVCLITGSGLKDIDSALKVAGTPTPVEPNFESARGVLEDLLKELQMQNGLDGNRRAV
jgi:threonine synthase